MLLLVAMFCSLPGCDGHDGKNDFLTWLAGLWATWSDVAVRSGLGTTMHLLGYSTLEIAGSAGLTDVGTAAAPAPVVFSCNVDLGGLGGWDYSIVLRGTASAAAGGESVHIVCDTPEGTPTTDTVTLDLTPNGDNTQLTGTLTFNHDGEDFTGDATFNKEETR
ncbi:hypothetical protein LLH23_23010 [bacterium]|nr:hypothetical protein [bacterium]